MKALLRRLRWAGGVWPLVVVLAAAAAGTCADFLNALARRESSLNPQAQNPYGYVGLFQMGEAALIDAGFYRPDGTGRNDWRGTWTGAGGVTSLQAFKDSPAAQVAAVTAYHQRLWATIQALGLDRYVGQTVGGVQMTRSGMIAAAHLVGAGNLATFLRSGGVTVPRDGNGTPLTEYAARFGGYELTGSGANCADFASGVPTGGIPIGGTPSTPVTPSFPFEGLTTEDAYYRGAGFSPEEVAWTVRATLAAVVLLSSLASLLGGWLLFTEGHGSKMRLVRQCQRVSVFLLLASILLL
jgi:hypothetical protein